MKDGGPAFPVQFLKTATVEAIEEHPGKGMTLRDYFAGKVIEGLPATPIMDMNYQQRAVWAYKQADAMLAERQKEDK